MNKKIENIDGDIFFTELIDSSDDDYTPLKKSFNTAYFYYVGPHSGCGCGWEVSGTGSDYEEKCKSSVIKLKYFLNEYIKYGTIEAISCSQEAINDLPSEVVHISIENFIGNLNKLRVPYNENYSKKFILST